VALKMNPIAVVGYDVLTAFGCLESTFAALAQGRNGFVQNPSKWNLRSELAATITDRPSETLSAGAWQRYLGAAVMQMALRSASMLEETKRQNAAYIFATSFGHFLDDASNDTMSTWAKDCLVNLGIDSNPIVVGTGCSSGADAISLAAAMLNSGVIDVGIVVAVDIVTPVKQLAHSTIGTMSSSAIKPFDVKRSGTMLGEAAAAVVVKRIDDCPEKIGQLLGFGSSNDASGLTKPDSTGLSMRLAIDRALGAAELQYDDIELYYAHATGTPLNDDLEANVVSKLFGRNENFHLAATKGALGHSLGACGLTEFILMLQMLKCRRKLRIIGLDIPLDNINRIISNSSEEFSDSPIGLSLTLGFGGFNTALIGSL
jgi:3-oxoacyl-[acyl-carrier-protein] synthase II